MASRHGKYNEAVPKAGRNVWQHAVEGGTCDPARVLHYADFWILGNRREIPDYAEYNKRKSAFSVFFEAFTGGRKSMKEIRPDDYPALVSAVERYLEAEEDPSVDAVCAILGIQKRKKAECVAVSVISIGRARQTVSMY